MMFLYRAAIAALIVATPAFAQTAPKSAATKSAKATAAKPAAKAKAKTKLQPPALNIAEKNGFSVMQVAAPYAQAFTAAWKIGNGAKVASTRTVADKPLFTFLIFRGCKPDAEGKCDIVADFTITRPDGTTNDDNKGVVIWDKAAPSDPAKPMLGDGALGYGVDSEGPFGDYLVVATVTDKVSATTVTTQQTLTIAPALATPEVK